METALGIVSVIALAVAMFMIGRLSGENVILKQQNPGTNLGQRHEMARMEDSLAVIADLRIRREIEKQRQEAVDNYFTERIDKLANYLSSARHDPEAPARRPKDY